VWGVPVDSLAESFGELKQATVSAVVIGSASAETLHILRVGETNERRLNVECLSPQPEILPSQDE